MLKNKKSYSDKTGRLELCPAVIVAVHTIDTERIFLVRMYQGLIFQMMLPKGQVNQAEVTAYTFAHITAATLVIIFLGR